jgi:ATP-dependent DNA helicase RecG
MLTQEELITLLNANKEQDYIECTKSTDNTDKFAEAICAFANDYPDRKKSGYLLIGVKDDGKLAGLKVSDKLQKDMAAIRNNGQILPQPAINTATFSFPEGDVFVVEVAPAYQPPVRYKGKIWIRIGATKAVANETEERRLIEKRSSNALTFDARPCYQTNINDDLALPIIQLNYLPTAINAQILAANHRDLKQQLASLRLYDLKNDAPTNAAILLFGLNVPYYFSGAYIEYVKIDDTAKNLSAVSLNTKFEGALFDILPSIDSFIKNQIIQAKPQREANSFRDTITYNYPQAALREFVMNAIMHRDYESNAPIYIYHYTDRIEIINSGYLYGAANKNNFPNASDYRNPMLAEAMKNLGYVNKFNFGIADAQNALAKNGSPAAEFDLKLETKLAVTIKINPSWLSE